MTTPLSPRRRREVVNALRRGTVPHNGLDVLAVGLDRFAATMEAELDGVTGGAAVFKAVRGEYGSGKTFFARWLGELAKQRGMAVAEVQISETETPLHRLETVYRRICESLQTAEFPPSALRPVLDAWLFGLEQEAGEDIDAVLERRLAAVSQTTPAFAAALRAYRRATQAGDSTIAEGLVAWLGGQPHVAAAVRRGAGVRGDLDHFGAFGFLQGLLTVLRDSGHPGLLLILDEVETLQRARSDVRDKALNSLRQLIDEVDSGRFPGLYLLITGTPAFFEGTQGVQRLAPLAQRLATDFTTDARFDNPRAVQIRLVGFTREALREVGVRVRDIYASDVSDPTRITNQVDDDYIGDLALAVAGRLGGKVGVAPRLFLKKLIGDVLDRVDQFPDFDPRLHYSVLLNAAEMTDIERNAASADEVALDLP
ncbi:BREX system ATP-binding protein BrxD [Actinoplanes xinjiangensis]|uniref:P-loop uncharacterized protein DUF2791 n=1 Tax=Actinoplanes xinjiangensis TaxID=512350 RepID=A0A316FMH2_9ACTN|nr:BREX system ATP-binding protein BrxD [Actinoplanes xinjiangensis]PWK49463.1 P-loop uncharacterized protein DUF2791 [Actinoplanes xinjiangensis]GIF37467.1 ATP-binding protein [Actinoplanes xinjiangensis]